MGSIYMRTVMGVENPRVGLINNGAEEEKGNALVKETFPLLKQCTDINFTGSIDHIIPALHPVAYILLAVRCLLEFSLIV